MTEQGLTEVEIEKLKEYGLYSCQNISNILADLYGYDEIFGERKISELISILEREKSRLWRKEHLER